MTELDTDATRALLAERAHALARRAESAPAGEELTVVGFSIGDEAFRIEAQLVREVVRLRHLAKVPGAPVAVRGVTTYRGEILALVDVRAALGRPDAGLADLLWVVVVGTAAAEFGLVADSVAEVTSVRVDELRPLPGEASAAAWGRARAVTADVALVLDGAALLADAGLFTLSEGTAGGATGT